MPGTNDLPRTYLAPLPRPRRVLWLLRQALIGSYEDGVIGFAKGAAYSALLAFFPVFTSLTAILVQANAAEVSHIITNFLFEAVPPGTEEIVRYNLTQEGARPLWLLVGAALISALAASGVMTSLMDGFQAIYRLPTGRSFWRQRLVAVLLVYGAALPVVGASALIVLGSRTEREITLMQEYRTRLTADIVTGKLDVREAAAKLPDVEDFAASQETAESELAEELETEQE